jgi:membrane fusion protein, multidrug efflux system
MLNKRNLTLITGTLLLGAAIVFGALPAEETAGVRRDGHSRVVRVAAVEWTSTGREARFPGVTRSAERASLAFTVPARVVARPVEVGDRVGAGEIVARLDDREYVLAYRSAAAALADLDVRLEQARRDQARIERLAESRAATLEELEGVQAVAGSLTAVREAAAARVEEMRRMLDETVLRAPFDGTVTNVEIEPGEWAAPGSTVLEISGNRAIEVRIEVTESIRTGVSVGSVVRVDFPMSEGSATGRVVSVAEAAAGRGSLFQLVAKLDSNEGVVPGMAAEVVLTIESAPALTVPLAAVLDTGSSRPSVFRIEGNLARRVPVRPGRIIGDRLTVTADGLAEGDSVAVVGHTALVEGDRVEVR